HLAIACDVPNRSSITQLNHLLAVLICTGKSVDLNHLYRGRRLVEINLIAGTDANSFTPRLSLAYPVTGSSALINDIINDGSTYIQAEPELDQEIDLQTEGSTGAPTMVGVSAIPQHRSTKETEGNLHLGWHSGDTEVLSNYLDSLTEFHQKMTAMQQKVMIAYLRSEEEN
ncbi:MAG: hypothetical protein K2Z81_21080, partial [Cyanobacteria bacterium]|nr:hypothetical protein [Cyanobacteriota bacterium]